MQWITAHHEQTVLSLDFMLNTFIACHYTLFNYCNASISMYIGKSRMYCGNYSQLPLDKSLRGVHSVILFLMTTS